MMVVAWLAALRLRCRARNALDDRLPLPLPLPLLLSLPLLLPLLPPPASDVTLRLANTW